MSSSYDATFVGVLAGWKLAVGEAVTTTVMTFVGRHVTAGAGVALGTTVGVCVRVGPCWLHCCCFASILAGVWPENHSPLLAMFALYCASVGGGSGEWPSFLLDQ